MALKISRRRLIAISASFVGGALACAHSGSAVAKILTRRKPVTWTGIALGARAQITLTHDDANAARDILERCRFEISRLERLFSLYQPDSALSILNRDGQLDDPAPEMLELMSRSVDIGHETNGAFDITVQPLWQIYSDHFSQPVAQRTGPSKKLLGEALSLVDFNKVEVLDHRIRLKRRGMGVTLNGIAQGYITDKVSALLRGAGYANVLVHLGETYAMGRKCAGQPWVAGIQDPIGKRDVVKTIALENRALATSGGYGTRFSVEGEHHHLFDPRTGRSTNKYRCVSVIAPDALSADALSTAFSSMDVPDIERLIERRQAVQAVIIRTDNQIIEL